MDDKRRLRTFGILLLLLGAGGIGLLAGVFLYRTSPPPSGAQAPPTATEVSGYWTLTFRNEIRGGTLAEGGHEYVIGLSCPEGLQSGSYSGQVDSRSGVERWEGAAYLRTDGVWTEERGGEPVVLVSPQQPVVASVSLNFETRGQAELARRECKVSIRLDVQQSQRLEPGEPQEADWGADG